MSGCITKEEFYRLIAHRRFHMPVFEVISPPFKGDLVDVVLMSPEAASQRYPRSYPCPANFSILLHGKVTQVLDDTEDDIALVHRQRWLKLMNALTQEEWGQLWENHPYQTAVIHSLYLTGIRASSRK